MEENENLEKLLSRPTLCKRLQQAIASSVELVTLKMRKHQSISKARLVFYFVKIRF